MSVCSRCMPGPHRNAGEEAHKDTHTNVRGLNLIVITDFVKTKLQGKTEA